MLGKANRRLLGEQVALERQIRGQEIVGNKRNALRRLSGSNVTVHLLLLTARQIVAALMHPVMMERLPIRRLLLLSELLGQCLNQAVAILLDEAADHLIEVEVITLGQWLVFILGFRLILLFA